MCQLLRGSPSKFATLLLCLNPNRKRRDTQNRAINNLLTKKKRTNHANWRVIDQSQHTQTEKRNNTVAQ